MGVMSELHIEKMTIEELAALEADENFEEQYQYDTIIAAAEIAAVSPKMFELFHKRLFELMK